MLRPHLAGGAAAAGAFHEGVVDTVTFELISSDASIPAVKVISAEEVQFAANFGMVKRVDKTMDGASRVIDPGSTWVIYDATVSGRTLAESVVSGSSKLVQLEHIGLVADRTRARYIAALPASGAFPGGLATIDASTGAVLQTLAVAEQPEVLAVSPDGRFLYAGLNGTGELAKYDLSTMALVARTPISGRAVSIAISPVDLESVAVARTDLCSGCTGPTSGVVLLKSMVLQPNVSYDRFYSTTIIGFDPSGSVLYSVDSGSTAGTFVRHLVLADGLQPDSILPSTTFLFPGAIWFDGSQMGIGMHVFGLPGPTYRFDLRPNFYTQCVPLQAGVSTGVAVCLEGAGPYPPVGVAQLEVALVDMSTGALLAKPSYATLSALRSASMVTGIVGQIAFSEKSDGFLRTYSQIRIYSNPILR